MYIIGNYWVEDEALKVFMIPSMSAESFIVKKGETIRITDVEGKQPGDLVSFNLEDTSERFSQARTRVENRKSRVTENDTLWTNANPPRVMFTITRDTCGTHDLLYTPCCRYALATRFGVRARKGQEHISVTGGYSS
jgi:uncharacterized protein YcgI (DUF1989 family)